jgi:hypothetical protein
MIEFYRLAGVGIWPVTVFGLVTLYAAARYAWRAAPERLALALGGGALTLLAGVLGSVVGFQSAVEAANGEPSMIPVIAMAGAREALNNLVLALVLVMLACMVATAGAWRSERRAADSAGRRAAV